LWFRGFRLPIGMQVNKVMMMMTQTKKWTLKAGKEFSGPCSKMAE
jgi:hypothetical protein